jgi:hypothetical protein
MTSGTDSDVSVSDEIDEVAIDMGTDRVSVSFCESSSPSKGRNIGGSSGSGSGSSVGRSGSGVKVDYGSINNDGGSVASSTQKFGRLGLDTSAVLNTSSVGVGMDVSYGSAASATPGGLDGVFNLPKTPRTERQGTSTY